MPLEGVKLSWDLKITPEELFEKTDKLILRSRAVFDAVGAVPDDDVGIDTVLKPLADVERDIHIEGYQYIFASDASTDKALRDASSDVQKKLTEFDVEIDMRKDLFRKLQVLEAKKLTLDPETDRYLKKLMQKRKRNGLHLSEETQEEIKKLKNRIEGLGVEFRKNLNDDKTSLEFTDEELVGLPEDFIGNLSTSPDSGKKIVTMKYPDYIPISRKAKNPETRRKIYMAYNSRCMKENTSILEEIVEIKHKLANILGYPTFSDYNAEILMSKSAANISNFLADLAKKLAPLWNDEKKYMLELKEQECKELGIPFDGQLNVWDVSYYAARVEEIKYAVDENKLQEYFPLSVVTKGLLDIYQILLGLKFQEIKNEDVWHEDVQTFSVSDAENGQLLGYFFLDLFPREGKYTHAALFELQGGCLQSDGSRQVAVAAMLTNFTKPTSEKPSLLTHDEVETFFHEFGHVMHFICAEANYHHFSGTYVEIDFVEAPSQMLENWCWVPQTLRMMSSHYDNHSPLPQDMTDALIKSRLANAGYTNLRQLVLGMFDQQIHTCEKSDVIKVYADVMKKLLGLAVPEGISFPANFQHMVDAYGAGYYGYMWSEVFSHDMFETCFGKDNILNPDVGKKYRSKILQPGGTKDAMDMLKDFLGREPNQNAFLTSKGLSV